MDKKYTLIDLINELHKNYEPGEEYKKYIESKFKNVIKNENNDYIIYINFKDRPNDARKEKLNISFNNTLNNYRVYRDDDKNINKHISIKEILNENVKHRTTGYYIIVSELDKEQFTLQIGQGLNFYTKNQEIYLDGYNGRNSNDSSSIEIGAKIEIMEKYLFDEAIKIAKNQNYNKEYIEELNNIKLINLCDYNMKNEELKFKIDILKRIIACYPSVMEKYINRNNLTKIKNKYIKIHDAINELRIKQNKNKINSGKVFSIFNWMYMEHEVGVKWTYKEDLKKMLKSIEQNNNKEANLLFEDVKGKNVIYHGVPGSGKSYFITHFLLYDIEDTNYERIVFYPEYSYTDFVGTYKLRADAKIAPIPGPFTRILTKAILNRDKQFVLVIEEMNRGNAEAIFGDIFQILDREDETYIINNDFIIDCINEKIEDDDEKLSLDTKIKLPSNLTILATINTSDQNVFNLDTAFARRWDYVPVTENFLKDNNLVTEEVKNFENDNIKGFNTKWDTFRKAINNAILSSNNIWSKEDKQLGKFYISTNMLCGKENIDYLDNNQRNIKIREKFLNKVMRYLWNDVFKAEHSELIEDERINALEKLVDLLRQDADSLNNLLIPLREYNKENN